MSAKWIPLTFLFCIILACGDDNEQIVPDDDYWIKEGPALHNFNLDAVL